MKTDGQDRFRVYPVYPSDILDILIRINPLTPFTHRRIDQLRRTVLETRINIHHLDRRKQAWPRSGASDFPGIPSAWSSRPAWPWPSAWKGFNICSRIGHGT